MNHSIGPPTPSARVGGLGPQCYVVNNTATVLHQQQYPAPMPLLLPQPGAATTTPSPYAHQNSRKLTSVNTAVNKTINGSMNGYNQPYSVVQQTPQVVSVITQRNLNTSVPHTINNNYYQSKVSNPIQMPSTANHSNAPTTLYYFDGGTSTQTQQINHQLHSTSREGNHLRMKQNTAQVITTPQSYYNDRVPVTNRNSMTVEPSPTSSSFFDMQRWPQSQSLIQPHQYNTNTNQAQNNYNIPNTYYNSTSNLYNNNVQVQDQHSVEQPLQQSITTPTAEQDRYPIIRVVVPDIESELGHLMTPVSCNSKNASEIATASSLPAIVKCSKPSFMDSYLKFINGGDAAVRETNAPPPAKKLLLPPTQPTVKTPQVCTPKASGSLNTTKSNATTKTSTTLTLDDDPRYFPLAKSTCRFSSSDSDEDHYWSTKSSTSITTAATMTITNTTATTANSLTRNTSIASKGSPKKKRKSSSSSTTTTSESKQTKSQNRKPTQPKRRQLSNRVAKSKTVAAVKSAVAAEDSADSDIDPAWTP
ncbi:uncharacterized protein LOC126844453 [Adelges cooleyi]|uniref:uncharacterized protein LOC126844453 n=1 Tax=Adelges cooleyi TaxID=133065 RepID=UPI00218041FE|nr:uncharacterized protein LOC126844453 [Adelges cooleyi]XP_050438618.1 uncharacterized protein LOC126844453 [Adelges cooleyi]XP_050438620.1 uncharacterized protein LOC126844453 [Adelges cooleyi]